MSETKMFPILRSRNAKPHPTEIPWELADLAYSIYSARYGREQSLERLAERGGFGPEEMDMFLPDWRERCDINAKLKLEFAAANERAEKAEKSLEGLQAEVADWLCREPHAQLRVMRQRAEAAERRAEENARRLEWIERRLFERRWNGVIDSGSQVYWEIAGDFRHTQKHIIGNTFPQAIDAARSGEGKRD